jgi:Domain of unknown function (DUF1083).
MISTAKNILFLGLLGAGLATAGVRAAAPHETQPIPLEGWTAKDPSVVEVTETGSELILKYGPFPQEWQIIEGPEVTLGARDRFFKNRRCRVTMEIKTSGLEGYALQLRARQRSGPRTEGGAFTRNMSPRREWNSAAELNRAEKYRTWARLEGTFTLSTSTERLAFEIWVSSPEGRTARVQIRNLELTELGEVEHIVSSAPDTFGNIFFSGSGGMKAEFVDPEKLTAARIELLDEEGRTVGQATGRAGTGELTIPLSGPGFYTVRATADYPGGKSISAATTAAVVGEPLDETVRRQSRLGTFRVWGNSDLWLKSGANWDWGIGGVDLSGYTLNEDGTISPPKDAKPLTYSDAYKTIFTIGGLPGWVMPDGASKDSLMAPKDWGLFERLIETFAQANPDLPWFCSYNEPDAHWRGSAEDFVKFHKAIAAGVKKGNPKMKFYGPCMYSIRMDDFRKYASMGLLDCLDGLVMHAYVDGTEPEGEFISRVTELLQFLKDSGHGDMPVFITEFGWCAEIGDWQKTVTERERSQYAPRSIALLAAQPIDAIEYFVFKHTSEPGKPGYSMIYSDNTPTPTYVAFVNTLKWLSWTRREDGRWFAFSPKLHLTLFQGNDRCTGAAWNTEGKARLTLPAAPLRMGDTMGRTLPVDGPVVEVGPAPVFFDLPECRALFAAATLPPVTVAPGESFSLPWDGFFAAPEIRLEGDKATVAPDARPGNYLVLGRTGDAFQSLPVRVLDPLSVESVDFKLSPDGRELLAEVWVSSPIRTGAEVICRLNTDAKGKAEIRKRLEPDVPAVIELSVPGFRLGQRVQGTLDFSLEGAIPVRIEKAFDQTYILCPSMEKVEWKTIPSVDISRWNPYPGELKAEDLSGSFQTAVTPEGFRLRVDVQDNAHHQNQLPSYMWNGDSIQFAFDVDADKEWQPNNVGNGHKGHRIFEYGVGLPNKGGKPMVWRWRADAPGFTASSEESRIVAEVNRDGNRTVYDVLIPWETLGLSAPPEPGSSIGFALVVNDLDNGADQRKALRIFSGVLEHKNPEGFGKLKVLAPSARP